MVAPQTDLEGRGETPLASPGSDMSESLLCDLADPIGPAVGVLLLDFLKRSFLPMSSHLMILTIN